MGSRDVPGKRPHGEQADRELVPADADTHENQSPDEMSIDASRLFEQATEQTRMAITVTDPHRPDNPIVYANQAFVEMTGYERDEIVGHNCRFLQGPGTDPGAVKRIRAALDRREVRVIELVNYKKDGTPFWNSLHVGPVFDETGELTHFYGSQWNVTELVDNRAQSALQRRVTEELQHRTRNLFAVVNAIVRVSARDDGSGTPLADRIAQRIDAMARAHAASILPGGGGRDGIMPEAGDLRSLAGTVLEPYRTDRADRLTLDGPEVELPPRLLTPIGLTLHEMATNALKYGALSRPGGRVTLEWSCDDDALTLRWSEAGGPEIVDAPSDTGTGSRLIRAVLSGVDGEIEMRWPREGVRADIRLPLRTT